MTSTEYELVFLQHIPKKAILIHLFNSQYPMVANRWLFIYPKEIVMVHKCTKPPGLYIRYLQLKTGKWISIRLNKTGQWGLSNQKVGVGRPEAYFWDTSEVNMAKIVIKSKDQLCGILYLNNREESIYYQNGEVNTEPNTGFRRLTFSGRLDLNLNRDILKDRLFLYILLQPEDSLCDPQAPFRNQNTNKVFDISIETVEEVGFLLPLAFFLGLFLAPPFLLVFYIISQFPKKELQPLPPDPPLISFESSSEPQTDFANCFEMASLQDDGHLSVGRVDFDPNAVEPIVKDAGSWSAGDLTFVFYMVPGLLLSAFQYVQSFRFDTLEDTCYHNYGCAVSWGPIVAFNHLISNIGYVINGIYYTVFVVLRHRHHYVFPSLLPIYFLIQRGRGPFNNFGLEMSLGMALVCQGLASTIYHICPSSISFTFDTPFMQAMCVLVVLKLYGNRHGPVSPSFANGIVAAVLAANICTTLSEHTVTSRLIVSATQLTIVGLSLHKIFKGNSMIHGNYWSGNTNTKYKIFGVVTILTNLLMVIGYNYGAYKSSQCVTIICIVNMTIYLLYYYFMKIRSHEKHNWLSTLAGAVSIVLWTVAAVFFFHEETNWKLTPAQSRNLNSDCSLFKYYDNHDIWHMLSAEAAFSSLIALSTLDDCQSTFPRTEITIF